MDFGELGWGGVDWIGLAEARDQCTALVNVVLNLWVPQNAEFFSSCTTGGFSRSAQLHRARSGSGFPSNATLV
jgi:hypothetical protein